MLNECKVIQIILGAVFCKIAFSRRVGGSQGYCVMILRPSRKGCSAALAALVAGASAGEFCVRSVGAAS